MALRRKCLLILFYGRMGKVILFHLDSGFYLLFRLAQFSNSFDYERGNFPSSNPSLRVGFLL